MIHGIVAESKVGMTPHSFLGLSLSVSSVLSVVDRLPTCETGWFLANRAVQSEVALDERENESIALKRSSAEAGVNLAIIAAHLWPSPLIPVERNFKVAAALIFWCIVEKTGDTSRLFWGSSSCLFVAQPRRGEK